MKKAVLELGGSDAYVVLADADVERAAATAVRARFNNAGQSCVCAKRFIVEAQWPTSSRGSSSKAPRRWRWATQPTPRRTWGPWPERTSATGSTDRCAIPSPLALNFLPEAAPVDGDGDYYEPTVLAVAGPGVPPFDEETFDPVATITVAHDEADAVRLTNATDFGLGLSVWSRDPARGGAFARNVTSGAAFINAMVASDARLPFGGTKRSGYGRELSDVGLREFVNIRTYWVAG